MQNKIRERAARPRTDGCLLEVAGRIFLSTNGSAGHASSDSSDRLELGVEVIGYLSFHFG
jgi:hypothetical protein